MPGSDTIILISLVTPKSSTMVGFSEKRSSLSKIARAACKTVGSCAVLHATRWLLPIAAVCDVIWRFFNFHRESPVGSFYNSLGVGEVEWQFLFCSTSCCNAKTSHVSIFCANLRDVGRCLVDIQGSASFFAWKDWLSSFRDYVGHYHEMSKMRWASCRTVA